MPYRGGARTGEYRSAGGGNSWRIKGLREIRAATPSPFHKGSSMTQEDVARITGVRQSYVSEVECGKYPLSAELAQWLAPHFGMSPCHLRLSHNLWRASERLNCGIGPKQALNLAAHVVELGYLTARGSAQERARVDTLLRIISYVATFFGRA